MRRIAQLGILLGALALPGVTHAEDTDAPRPKSPAMIATGIGMMTAGTAAVGLGIPFIVLGAHSSVLAADCVGCGARVIPPNDAYIAGGVIATVAGALAILGAIPMIYFGAKHERAPVAWLTPNGVAGRF